MKTFLAVTLSAGLTCATGKASDPGYQFAETEALVALVNDAAQLIATKGESAWADLKQSGSKWRSGNTYVFVLDTAGNMVCHPDPGLEGPNQLDLKDVNGKAIIQGILRQATTHKNQGGWFHYQWPEPDSIFPAWKTTFSMVTTAPSGTNYVVGSGVYNMKMERRFVTDQVKAAIELIESKGPAAFSRLRDPADEFLFKDTYVFVIGLDGTDLVNPAFPSLEGRSLLNLKDRRGKELIKEMIELVKQSNSGWVSYMWPKPGSHLSTEKSSYVSKAKCGERSVIVGCGVYLEGAPQEAPTVQAMDAGQLVSLVREAAAELEKKGEKAFPEFRVEGSNWRHGETYLFVWDIGGTRIFHGATPEIEGADVRYMRDVHGKPVGQMLIDTASSRQGEGWVHYYWPKPGSVFPGWKSTFLTRVTFPSGQKCFVGCGLYDMKTEKPFVTDAVDAACGLLASEGRSAFPKIRSKAGRFVFLDTYVFVMGRAGVEYVNHAFPSLEGRNLMDCRDAGANTWSAKRSRRR
jgi:signal transduction histidine kinase